MSQFSLIFVIVIFAFIGSCYSQEYRICQNDAQCGEGFCCVMSNVRESAPICLPKRQVGDSCRPFESVISNRDHYYGDQIIRMENVHNAVCPCMENLTCDLRQGICVNPH